MLYERLMHHYRFQNGDGGTGDGTSGGASGAGGEAGSGGSTGGSDSGGILGLAGVPGVAPGTPGKRPRTNEDIFQGFRELGSASEVGRQAQFLEGVAGVARRSQGSAIDLLGGLRSQIAGLREQIQQRYHAAASSLGPAGGRQTAGAQAQALTQGGSQLHQAFQHVLGQGNTALAQLLGALRPAQAAQLPQPYTSETSGPLDPKYLLAALQSVGNAYTQARTPGLGPDFAGNVGSGGGGGTF